MFTYNSLDHDTTSIILQLKVYSSCGGTAIYANQGLRQSGLFLVENLTPGANYKGEWIGLNSNEISISYNPDPEWINDICLDPPSDCNYVCNGDFENRNTTGTSNNSFWPVGNLNGWDKPFNSLSSPDGFWNDGPPPNGSGGNVPVGSGWTGNNGRNQSAGFAAIIAGHDQDLYNHYEYLQTKLVNPMLPGRKYLASMWVRHYVNSKWQINDLGMLFSQNAVQQSAVYVPPFGWFNYGPITSHSPQVHGPGGTNWIGTTWLQITDIIENTTGSNWEYLTVGNFNHNGQPNNVGPQNGFNKPYYFFDDIFVEEVPSAGEDWSICEGKKVSLGVLGCPTVGTPTIRWEDSNGIIVSTSFPYIFFPTQTETYTLYVTYNGISYTDQVTVTVDNNCCYIEGNDYFFNGTYAATNEFVGLNTLNHKDIVINGTFTFDRDFTFIDCHFYMGPNAEIIVDANTTLTFDNTTLESCNDKAMWNGIVMPNQSSNLVLLNSKVREAKTGVQVDNGANLNAQYTVFENNYKGVVLNQFGATHPAYFKGNTFITNLEGSVLLNPYSSLTRSHVGIEIIDVNSFTVGSFSTPIQDQNKFELLHYGIHITRSNAPIATSTFVENYFGVYADGDYNNSNTIYQVDIGSHIDHAENTFNDNGYGTHLIKGVSSFSWDNYFTGNSVAQGVYNQPDGCDYQIAHSTYQNNTYGIELADIVKPKFWIEGNMFNATAPAAPNKYAIKFENIVQPSLSWIPTTPPPGQAGAFQIFQNTIYDYDNGIHITNLAGPVIDENIIGRVPAYWSTATHGIRLYNCPRAVIEENQIAGTSSSLWAGHGIATDFAVDNLLLNNCVKDLGRGIWLGGQSTGLMVRGNTMENCNTGVFANWAFFGNQGWPHYTGSTGIMQPSDNEWVGSFTNHLYNFKPVVAYGNKFTLRGSGSINFVPGHYPSNFQSNFSQGDHQIIVYSSTITNPDLFYGFSVCTSSGWVLKTNPENNIFYSEEEIAMIADTSSLQVYGQEGEAQEWLMEQALYRELIQDTVDYTTNSVLNTFMGNAAGTNLDTVENIDEYIRLGVETGDLLNIATAKSLNNVMNGTVWPVQNTEEFNGVYIPELEEGDMQFELAAGDLQLLNTIANRCPYIYGTAVYQARAILRLADDNYTEVITPCELGYQNGTAKTDGPPSDAYVNPVSIELASELRIFPNPATDQIMVMFETEMYEEGTLQIVDATGRIVFSEVIQNNINTLIALPAGLANGLYLCQIIADNRIVEHEKLVVNK